MPRNIEDDIARCYVNFPHPEFSWMTPELLGAFYGPPDLNARREAARTIAYSKVTKGGRFFPAYGRLINALYESEPTMVEEASWYRDHTGHMTHVFMMAYFLVINTRHRICSFANAFNLWSLELDWASFLHDISYPLHYYYSRPGTGGLNNPVPREIRSYYDAFLRAVEDNQDLSISDEDEVLFGDYFETLNIANNGDRLNRLNSTLQNLGFDIDFSERFRRGDIDHGLLSALLALYLLDTAPDTTDDFRRFIDRAAAAISIHHSYESFYPRTESQLLPRKLRLTEFPVAFFLILADELHVWGRSFGERTDAFSRDDIFLDFYPGNVLVSLHQDDNAVVENVMRRVNTMLDPGFFSICFERFTPSPIT